MEKPTEAIFACSGCHKKFYMSGFKISRLGLRHKTCLECAARRARPRPVLTQRSAVPTAAASANPPRVAVLALTDEEVTEILGF